MDRIAPTRRPSRRALMRQDWHQLGFLHWEVSPEVLRPLVPPELSLDAFEGRYFVGLVPFSITGVRPTFASSGFPVGSRFHELNVRTYVHHDGAPGVWFFSLDAASPVAVAAARAAFALPYCGAKMAMTLRRSDGSERRLVSSGAAAELRAEVESVFYESDRYWPEPRGRVRLRYGPSGDVFRPGPGTLEHFLIERYLLYSWSGTTLYRGQVHHAPYPVQGAWVEGLEEDVLATAGIAVSGAPFAHYARGVETEIFALEGVG